MDYNDPNSILLVNWYCTTKRDLPLDKWPHLATTHVDDKKPFTRSYETHSGGTEYLYCRFVFLDGKMSGPSDIWATGRATKNPDGTWTPGKMEKIPRSAFGFKEKSK